jgi:hypothetical protein
LQYEEHILQHELKTYICVAKVCQQGGLPLTDVVVLFGRRGLRQGGDVVAQSQTQPVQVGDALCFSSRAAEEERSGSRGRIEFQPNEIEERSSATDEL